MQVQCPSFHPGNSKAEFQVLDDNSIDSGTPVPNSLTQATETLNPKPYMNRDFRMKTTKVKHTERSRRQYCGGLQTSLQGF